MRLTVCYLGILTVLCIVTLTVTVLAMVSNQWLRYSMEISRITPSGNVPVMKMTVSSGLYKTTSCTEFHVRQMPEVCSDIQNSDFVSVFDWASKAAPNTTEEEARSNRQFVDFLHEMQRKLKGMEVLAICGIVFQVVGGLLAMTFWRRSLERLALARWLLSAFCWIVSAILIMIVTMLGLPLNERQKNELISVSATDKTASTDVSVQTAWALLLSGLSFFSAFVTGAFVLTARCFLIPSHKYSPISLVTYEKTKMTGAPDGERLLEGEHEDAKLQMEYHD